jgi:nitrogen fixation-related uncharacterized protein
VESVYQSQGYDTQGYDAQGYDNYYSSYYGYYQTSPGPTYSAPVVLEEPKFYGVHPDLIMSVLTVVILLVITIGFFWYVQSGRTSDKSAALEALMADPDTTVDVYVLYVSDKDPAEVHTYLKEKGAHTILFNDQERWIAISVTGRGLRRIADQDWVEGIRPAQRPTARSEGSSPG